MRLLIAATFAATMMTAPVMAQSLDVLELGVPVVAGSGGASGAAGGSSGGNNGATVSNSPGVQAVTNNGQVNFSTPLATAVTSNRTTFDYDSAGLRPRILYGWRTRAAQLYNLEK